jgi:tetratricopeptide (TPR) repeat protein
LVRLLSTGVASEPRVDRINEALWWREHASATPESALRQAERWLSRAVRDTELRVLARHVACLASVERGRLRDARYHARLGLSAARRSGLREREAQLRLTLAWIELDRGARTACWQQLAASEPHLRGADLSRAACLRGLLHYQGDRYREAIAELTEALPRLQADGNRRWMANALLGRGLAQLYLNRLDEAEDDLLAAEQLFAKDGWIARAAACQHNRGYVAFRGGDLPRALRLFAQALATGLDTESNPEALVDRAEALAAAGLEAEAREAMRHAASQLAARGRAVRLADTRLALADRALRDGEPESAIEQASEARRLFRIQRRPAWSALAAATMWQARLRAGHRSRYTLAAAKRAASVCAGFGWTAAAAELWLTAGRSAARCGMRSAAQRLLVLAASSRDETGATAPQRAVGWLAEALLAEQRGDVRRVFEACRDGLEVIESHAAAMAAFELRVHAFGLAGELAETAMGAALRTGDPELVLRWTEASRASALNRRALHPPSDPALRSALVDLRAAAVELRDSPQRHPKETMAKVAALEDRVRHRAMLVDGTTGGLGSHCEIEEISAQLGNSVLVCLFVHAGQLRAVSVVDGEVRLSALGAERIVAAEVDKLRYLLAKQAEGASQPVAAAFSAGARHAAATIEEKLLAPVSPALEKGRPLVVVPTGRLHTLAWAALPVCRGRSVTVAPSLRCWLRAAADARQGRAGVGQVWVAGPGLEHAEREVRALHETAGGHLLVGDDATAERVLSTVDGASTVHIAAHGWFRDEQPLLSCLDMADGPLYGYDLDRLHRGPTTVVLSACEVGRSVVSRGDELRGLAAALLGRGTATVIASILPVPDERTAEVMVSLHTALRCGLPPAAALAHAQAEHGESGFICLGYGGKVP